MAKKSVSCTSILVQMTFLMIVLVLVVVGSIYIGYNKLNEFFNRGGTVIIPDFHGRHLVEVLQMKPNGIEIVSSNKKYDAKIPKDHVIAQFPQPGAVVKTGKQVMLTISLGAQQVKVPKLNGKTIRDVDVELLNSQLVVGNRSYVFSSSVPPDRVVGQSPIPDDDYSINQPVNLLISLGVKPEMIPLPNLTDVSLETAKLRLKAWGFNLGRVVSKQDENRAKFKIIATDPAPYSHLRKGDTINILISSGFDQGSATQAELAMFDVFGKKQSAPTIDMTGFRALNNSQTVTTAPVTAKVDNMPTPLLENNPVAQLQTQAPVVNPTPTIAPVVAESDISEADGYPIYRASDNKKAKPALETSLTSSGSALSVPQKEINYMMPDGFMQKELKIVHIKPSGEEKIYVGTHKPLELVKVKVPVVPNSKLQVYINDVPIEELKLD